MLDTNIVSDLIENPAGTVAANIRRVGAVGLGASVIVAAESRFSGLERGSPALMRKVEGVLSKMIVAPFETPAVLLYAEIRLALKRQGLPMGPNDLLIAAHARAMSATLATRNVMEFRRVSGLVIKNWLK